MWDEQTPAARFMQRLVRERAEEMIAAPQYMKCLRNDNETAVRYQRKFGKVWAQHGTNVYKLIAKACGDSPWDSEDEQKNAVVVEKKVSPPKEKYHDDLAPARQAGACLGIDLLQGEPEAGLQVVEKAEREKADPEEGGRREGFYRRSGGAPRPQEG